jgi:chorismate mutase
MYRTHATRRARSGRVTPPPPSLESLREQIDSLDDELLALVERRLAASRAVAELKSSRGDDHLCLRPRREQQVVARLVQQATVAPETLIDRLWRELMAFSLQAQVRTELILHGPDPEALRWAARERFGSAAPLRHADSAAAALDAALRQEAVAIVALEDGAAWIESLHPTLSIFDLLRDEAGEVVAAAVGRIPPEELPEPPTLPSGHGEGGR